MRHGIGRTLVALTVTLLVASGAPHTQTPAQRAVPPRDPSSATTTGTSGLKGHVVAADSGKPLRRAKVSIASTDSAGTRKTISTGLDGTYAFKDLPGGTYRISVTRSGYLPLDYGQRRPGELGRPVDVADGEILDQLDIALPRMGVVEGRVTDERGEPIADVTVLAMRSLFMNGRRSLVPIVSPNVQTDDSGEYRVLRLPPGTYYVMATTKETWTVMENGKELVLGYLPTYFPGAPNAGEAQRVTVGIGQELSGIDVSLLPGRTARVSGRAVDSQGKPFSQVSLNQEIRGLDFASFRGGPSAHVSGDGSFTVPDVPPGEYVVTALRMESEGSPEVALTSVTVDGTDIDNLVLVGSAGGTVSGRIVTAEDRPKMSAIRMTIGPVMQGQASPAVGGAFRNGGFTSVKEDGSFSVNHVFGVSRFQVTLASGWMVASITHEGRDITDTPFELASGDSWGDVEVRITQKIGTLTGDIVDDQNAPVTMGTVVVFAADREKWFDSSRYVRAARPNQQGRWRVTGLPPGDYLVAAVDYVENGQWNDPEYLSTVRDVARRITLQDAGSQTMRLKIVAPK